MEAFCDATEWGLSFAGDFLAVVSKLSRSCWPMCTDADLVGRASRQPAFTCRPAPIPGCLGSVGGGGALVLGRADVRDENGR